MDLAEATRAELSVDGKPIRRVVEQIVAEASHAIYHFDVGCSRVCGDRVPWPRDHGLSRQGSRRRGGRRQRDRDGE